MRVLRILSLLVIVCAGAAVLADQQRMADRPPVVYPMQRLPLIFSHRTHLERGIACAVCHANATTSRSSIDNLIPTEAACRIRPEAAPSGNGKKHRKEVAAG